MDDKDVWPWHVRHAELWLAHPAVKCFNFALVLDICCMCAKLCSAYRIYVAYSIVTNWNFRMTPSLTPIRMALPKLTRLCWHAGTTDSRHVSGHIQLAVYMTPRSDTVFINYMFINWTVEDCNCSSEISTLSSCCRYQFQITWVLSVFNFNRLLPIHNSIRPTHCKQLNCKHCIDGWNTDVGLSVVSIAVPYQTAFSNDVEFPTMQCTMIALTITSNSFTNFHTVRFIRQSLTYSATHTAHAGLLWNWSWQQLD